MLVSSANRIGTEVLFMVLGKSFLHNNNKQDPGQSLAAYRDEI
jgi:hypothetical protein